MKIYSYLLFTILMCSCGKAYPELPNDTNPLSDTSQVDVDTSEFNSRILWKSPFGDTTQRSFSPYPLLYEDLVIFSDDSEGPNGSDVVYAYDKNSGDVKWQFASPLLSYRNDIGSSMQVKGDNIFLANQKSVYSLNSNGALRWLSNVGGNDGSLPGNIIGNYYYYNKLFGSRRYPDSASIIRFDLANGDVETVLTLSRDKGYCPKTHGTCLWINGIGDSILIFQNRQLNIRSGDKVDLLAYNLSIDSIIWKIDSITPSGTSNIAVPPQIEDNFIYFQGGNAVIKIDPANGEIIWTFRIKKSGDGGFLFSNLIIKEGLVIANPISEKLFALSDKNGKIVWERGSIGSPNEPNLKGTRNMVYHEGYIYFGSGWHFVGIDVDNGAIKWYEKSPYSKPDQNNIFHCGIALDPANEVVYTSDGYWIIAIDISD